MIVLVCLPASWWSVPQTGWLADECGPNVINHGRFQMAYPLRRTSLVNSSPYGCGAVKKKNRCCCFFQPNTIKNFSVMVNENTHTHTHQREFRRFGWHHLWVLS